MSHEKICVSPARHKLQSQTFESLPLCLPKHVSGVQSVFRLSQASLTSLNVLLKAFPA